MSAGRFRLRDDCGSVRGGAGFPAFAAEELVGELFVGGGAESGGFVLHDGFAVAGSFAEADGARDDCAVDDILEMGLHLGDDGLREIVPHEHCQEDPGDTEPWIGFTFRDLRDDTVDFRESFEGEVFALDGDEEFVGSGEGVGHQDAEGGRAIEEDVVEGGFFA